MCQTCPGRLEKTLYFRLFPPPDSLLAAAFLRLPQNLQSLFSLNPFSDHLAGHYRFPKPPLLPISIFQEERDAGMGHFLC